MTMLAPEIWEMAGKIGAIFERHGLQPVITSARRSPEAKFSYHHVGRALDWRANTIHMPQERERVLAEIRSACGEDYDVVLHGEGLNMHYHVEYDPPKTAAVTK